MVVFALSKYLNKGGISAYERPDKRIGSGSFAGGRLCNDSFFPLAKEFFGERFGSGPYTTKVCGSAPRFVY